ncbi:MAG: hypothetical protein JWL72_1873 [Ilumatobacteraceae bacterium]|nr:hypothetical protein [Ilumatobacteraceae bacterium]
MPADVVHGMNAHPDNTRLAARMGAGLSRRTLLVALLGAPVLTAVVASCGDNTQGAGANPPVATGDTTPPTTQATTVDTTAETRPATTEPASTDPTADPTTDSVTPNGTGIAHPTGVDDVVVRLAYVGGFVPANVAFTSLPTVLISGDGRVYTQGVHTDIYPGPLVPTMNVRTITEAGIQKVLRAADDAHLLRTPPDYSAQLNIADAPDTQLILDAKDGTFVHQAYALGLADPAETKDRNVLNGVCIQIADLEQYFGADILGPDAAFEPTAYRIQATVVAPEQMPVATEGPTSRTVAWPAEIGVPLASAATCVVVPASTAGTILTDADQLTYFTDAGITYSVAAAPLLPGDHC